MKNMRFPRLQTSKLQQRSSDSSSGRDGQDWLGGACIERCAKLALPYDIEADGALDINSILEPCGSSRAQLRSRLSKHGLMGGPHRLECMRTKIWAVF